LEEIFGADAEKAQLRDISASTDYALNSLMERLRDELMRKDASQLFVSAIADAIAIHIARNYAESIDDALASTPSLPGHKLKRVTDWMAQHIAEDLNLDQLAGQVGLSKFHFARLFKRAMGFSLSHYHIDLRMNEARRLLRETKKSIIGRQWQIQCRQPTRP
jgi:AraC family transcriptional regulator